MGKFIALIVAAVAVLGLLPAGSSAEVVGKTIDISQEIYDERGNPMLGANTSPVGGKPVIWERCAPFSSSCEVVAGEDSWIEPGETAPGTTFKVRRAGVANAEVVTSHPWGGRLTPTTPPYVTGALKEMARVIPHPGIWAGGWAGDTDSVTLFACRYRLSNYCDVVTGAWYMSGEQVVNRPIGPRYVGWRLLLVTYRNPSDSFWNDMALGRTRANPINRPDASKLVADLGRVADSSEYSFRLLRRTHLDRKGRMAIAKVKCPGTCRVQIKAHNPSPYIFTDHHSSWTLKRRATLRIPGTAFKQRKALVSLTINGALAADGMVRISK